MKGILIKIMLFMAITTLGLPQILTLNGKGLFQEYKKNFSKSYKNSEDSYRLDIFQKNVAEINAHNSNPDKTYQKGINQFTDMPASEFKRIYLNLKLSPTFKNLRVEENPLQIINSVDMASKSIDWTTKGGVSEVKDQGGCGSCWAFGAIGAVQSAYLVKNKKGKYDFSEQQLVDCSGTYGNGGCSGGLEQWAYQYVVDHGINLESAYPYKGVDQNCTIDKGPYKISSYNFETGCKNVLAAIFKRPISVAIDASGLGSYASGLYQASCTRNLNHAVLLVGVSSKGWKVKNSWGKGWGEKGFGRLALGNTCGICDYPINVNL